MGEQVENTRCSNVQRAWRRYVIPFMTQIEPFIPYMIDIVMPPYNKLACIYSFRDILTSLWLQSSHQLPQCSDEEEIMCHAYYDVLLIHWLPHKSDIRDVGISYWYTWKGSRRRKHVMNSVSSLEPPRMDHKPCHGPTISDYRVRSRSDKRHSEVHYQYACARTYWW